MSKEKKELIKRYARLKGLKEKQDEVQIYFIYGLLWAIAVLSIIMLNYLPV
jgi:hypothetical protein